jgi:nicotinate-nucleotide adenylyltransferase
VRLAVANQPRMELSLLDAPHTDGRPNYTIDALRNLRRELHPDDQLYCLMGADSFLTIGKWHSAHELLLFCDFVVASRPGFDLQKIAAALPNDISLAAEENCAPGCLIIGLRTSGEEAGGPADARSRIYLLTDLEQDVSATEIRLELQAGAAEAEVDPAVAAYISEHGLYRNVGQVT